MTCPKCWNECVNLGELVRGICDDCVEKDEALKNANQDK